MQEKISKAENFPCEDCKYNKNHYSPVKLESKKQAEKVVEEQERSGGGSHPASGIQSTYPPPPTHTQTLE